MKAASRTPVHPVTMSQPSADRKVTVHHLGGKLYPPGHRTASNSTRSPPCTATPKRARSRSQVLVTNRRCWLYSSMELVHLTLSGLNSVAAVTQRSRTGLRGQTPSALRRIRLLRSCLNHDGLRSAAGIHRPRISRAGFRDAQPRSSYHGSEPHTVGGATHAAGAPVQDVGVDHRGADVTVTEQFLYGPDVVVVLQQVRGERMTKGVARR